MSDSRNIRNIYIYRILGICVSFASIFVVLPYLASEPERYAIYALSVSICMFLTYGDLGFCAAAQKYCAEEVGRGCLQKELEYAGFLVAVLVAIGVMFSGLMLAAANSPQVLLPQLNQRHLDFASTMFFMVGVFMPIQVVLQRFVMLILSSRLKEYYAIRIDLVANALKIFLAPMFVSSSGYLLEYFFLVSCLISILSCLLSLLVIRFYCNFPIESVLVHIRFSRSAYARMKNLAFSSLTSTFLFILYYEFDLILAARFFSLADVAAYAIAFSLMGFLRNISSVIYSPMLSYINRLYGKGEVETVKRSFRFILEATTPLFMVVTVVLYAGMEIFIFQWMGQEMAVTLGLVRVLLIGGFFVGLANTGPLLATTFERNRILLLFGLFPFSAYYGCFFIMHSFFPEFGITVIAYAKALSGIAASLFSLIYFYRSSIVSVSFIFKLLALTIVSLFLACYLVELSPFSLMTTGDSNFLNLGLFLGLMGIVIFLLWIVYLQIFSSTRELIKSGSKKVVLLFLQRVGK